MTEPSNYAGAFATFIETLLRIFSSAYVVPLLLTLILLAMGWAVWRLLSHRLSDLGERLDECEARHDDCVKRERRSLLVIAQLHGVVCALTESLPAEHPARARACAITLPPLGELMGAAAG